MLPKIKIGGRHAVGSIIKTSARKVAKIAVMITIAHIVESGTTAMQTVGRELTAEVGKISLINPMQQVFPQRIKSHTTVCLGNQFN